jgi:aminotransferase
MLCLCNPLNPTGKVFTRRELEKFGELACRHNLLIMSDEIWSDIVFEPHAFTSMAALGTEISERTITVTGFSKSYGLAGLRIGAVLAHDEKHFKDLYDASLHKSTIHGANVLSQVAATTALNKCENWLGGFVRHLQRMRDICTHELNTIEGVNCLAPEGCYVAFADIRGTGMSSSAVHELLLDKGKVTVVPGLKQWFGEGAEGYVRLSFATSEDILREAMNRIKNTLGKE